MHEVSSIKENIEEFTIMDVTANAIKESDIAIKGTGINTTS